MGRKFKATNRVTCKVALEVAFMSHLLGDSEVTFVLHVYLVGKLMTHFLYDFIPVVEPQA